LDVTQLRCLQNARSVLLARLQLAVSNTMTMQVKQHVHRHCFLFLGCRRSDCVGYQRNRLAFRRFKGRPLLSFFSEVTDAKPLDGDAPDSFARALAGYDVPFVIDRDDPFVEALLGSVAPAPIRAWRWVRLPCDHPGYWLCTLSTNRWFHVARDDRHRNPSVRFSHNRVSHSIHLLPIPIVTRLADS